MSLTAFTGPSPTRRRHLPLGSHGASLAETVQGGNLPQRLSALSLMMRAAVLSLLASSVRAAPLAPNNTKRDMQALPADRVHASASVSPLPPAYFEFHSSRACTPVPDSKCDDVLVALTREFCGIDASTPFKYYQWARVGPAADALRLWSIDANYTRAPESSCMRVKQLSSSTAAAPISFLTLGTKLTP